MEGGAFPFRTEEGKWGLASADGSILCMPVYDALSPLPKREGQYLLCCRGFDWGLLNNQGVEVLDCEWQDIVFVPDALMAVCRDGLWGFARMELGRFRVVTPVTYGEWKAAEAEEGGIFAIIVRQDTPWGTMTHQGSHMTLQRYGVLDGQANVLARPQWKYVKTGGSTDHIQRFWWLERAYAKTEEGEIPLIENGQLTQLLKKGAYR